MFAYSNNGIASRRLLDPSKQVVGEVYFDHQPTSDELASAFPGYNAAVSAQQAIAAAPAALTAGLTITSTGTPEVSGTYSCDDAQQSVVARLQTYIEKNNAFPGGLSSVQLRLANGAFIPIPSIPLFQAIGSAIADYVAKVDEAELAALSGAAWVAPSNTATIA